MRFDYGDEALLMASDTAGALTKRSCCIVGITEVENSKQAEAFERPVGEVLYTVEFADGTDQLVSEQELQALP